MASTFFFIRLKGIKRDTSYLFNEHIQHKNTDRQIILDCLQQRQRRTERGAKRRRVKGILSRERATTRDFMDGLFVRKGKYRLDVVIDSAEIIVLVEKQLNEHIDQRCNLKLHVQV